MGNWRPSLSNGSCERHRHRNQCGGSGKAIRTIPVRLTRPTRHHTLNSIHRQATPKTQENYGGSGLGLFISRKCKEHIPGAIDASANMTQCANFTEVISVSARRRVKVPRLVSSSRSGARMARVTTADRLSSLVPTPKTHNRPIVTKALRPDPATAARIRTSVKSKRGKMSDRKPKP